MLNDESVFGTSGSEDKEYVKTNGFEIFLIWKQFRSYIGLALIILFQIATGVIQLMLCLVMGDYTFSGTSADYNVVELATPIVLKSLYMVLGICFIQTVTYFIISCFSPTLCCDLRQQIADCCCQTQRGIDGINYNMAMNNSALQQTLCNNTRDIIDNQNANYRALHDEIVANRIEDKNAQIAAQQNEINALRLKASQEAQNTYLINQLKPCPSAAYIVPNPNCCYNYTVNGYGYNNCGCGNY